MGNSIDDTKKTYLLTDPSNGSTNPILHPRNPLSLPKGQNSIPRIKYHDYNHLYDNFEPLRQKWVVVWCKDVECDQCHNPEAFRIARQLTDFVEANPAPNWFFLTLSTPNRMDLGLAYDELQIAFSNMIKQASKDPNHHWNQITHWIGVTEIKLGKNGFNVHRHIIAATRSFRLPYKQCHEEWNQASNCKAAHYNMKKIHHPLQNNIRYLSKYMSKDAGWGGLDTKTLKVTQDLLRGKRRITRSRAAGPLGIKKPVRVATRKSTDWKFCCVAPPEQLCK